MRTAILLLLMAAALALSGCETSGYALVGREAVSVAGGTMTIRPAGAWNKAQGGSLGPQEEFWTKNGPVLDRLSFVGGVRDGEAIVKQRAKDERKVPAFQPAMTPQDLTSMVESTYRIRRGAKLFETTGVKPATFLGEQGVQFDFNYMGDDDVRRRGRSMLAVAGNKLYVMTLEGTALHYFDAALPEFEAMAASATVRQSAPPAH